MCVFGVWIESISNSNSIWFWIDDDDHQIIIIIIDRSIDWINPSFSARKKISERKKNPLSIDSDHWNHSWWYICLACLCIWWIYFYISSMNEWIIFRWQAVMQAPNIIKTNDDDDDNDASGFFWWWSKRCFWMIFVVVE